MNDHDKTNGQLIGELQELRQNYDSLKAVSDTNIAELRQVAEKCRLSEQRYRLILELTGQIGWSTPPDGLVEDLPMWRQYCGLGIEEIKGWKWLDTIHPDDRESAGKAWNNAVQTGDKQHSNEYRIRRADGVYRNFMVRGMPLLDETGSIREWIGTCIDITDSPSAQKHAQENEEWYGSLLSNLEVGIVVHAPDTSIIINNLKASQILGLPDAQMRGKVAVDPLWHFVHEDGTPLMLDEYPVNKVASTGKPIKNQVFGIHKPGGNETLWITANGYPVQNASGAITEIVISFIDITERKLYEEKLKDSLALLRIAGEKAKLGGWNVILKENRSYWSDEVAAIHEMPAGYTPLVQDGINFYAPEWRERIIKVFTDCAQKGIPYDEEMEILTARGKRVWIKTIGEALRDDHGNIFKVHGAFQDISERKKTEAALIAAIEKAEQSEEKLRDMANLLPQVIFESDSSGTLTYVNTNAYRTFGYPEDFPIVGKSSLDFYTPESRLKAVENIRKKIAGIPAGTSNEYMMIRNDGTTFPALVYSNPILKEGKSVGLRGIIVNISELKEAEAKIVKLNEELEMRVRQRTFQLEESNKELESFSYSIAHDLRAPLRHINGYISMLNEKFKAELPETAVHYLSVVANASKRMDTLIEDLLQFSRTGRQELHEVSVAMNVLIEEVLERIRPDTEKRKIAWSIQDLPVIPGDYSLLEQVWMNLLNNAVKFTRNVDSAEISVGYKEEDENIVFWVRDNGIGFDMQYAHKLFGVFQRLHSQSDFEGTGIGLANVQRIVHRHNGRVWAEAEPGKGATFHVSLPKSKDIQS